MPATAHTRLLDALNALARTTVDALDADACAISRVLGDVLIYVTGRAFDGRFLADGQGYLVSEYPETRRVLERREPRAVCLGDPDGDPGEQRLLRDHGFGSLLMLPLELHGSTWGLVEVYRKEAKPFGALEMRAATLLLDEIR